MTNIKKLQLLSDINKVIEAITGEVDAYLASVTEKHPVKKKLLTEIRIKRQDELKTLSKKLTAKHGQTN